MNQVEASNFFIFYFFLVELVMLYLHKLSYFGYVTIRTVDRDGSIWPNNWLVVFITSITRVRFCCPACPFLAFELINLSTTASSNNLKSLFIIYDVFHLASVHPHSYHISHAYASPDFSTTTNQRFLLLNMKKFSIKFCKYSSKYIFFFFSGKG